MFTGIVEEAGVVEKIHRTAKRIELCVRSKICGQGTRLGDSIAVNGCCLTVVGVAKRSAGTLLRFDLLRETWRLTNLQYVGVGASVNLERSLSVGGRLGGHFVSGHIDGMGKVVGWHQQGSDWELEVAVPRAILRYVACKGSVALDGISLTVGRVRRGSFVVWIIPHTLDVTTLRDRKVGEFVNIEVDILAKYVERIRIGAR